MTYAGVRDAVTESGLPSERLDAAGSISLLQTLSAVPDPRRARGRRHSLQSMMLLAAGAVLAGRPLARGDRTVGPQR
ncbi:transposase family protein [Modestobacter altitudinis]|uniref:transposase family protein n=1 Tax=Modestobacter altitudinis TaxID=2213158 RepID=UPI00110C932E|nr:transposase family protein [Modestobacter altitudinis]